MNIPSREFIQRLNQWLATAHWIVATHRVPVLELVERVVVLKEGQLVMDAPESAGIKCERAPALTHGREWKMKTNPHDAAMDDLDIRREHRFSGASRIILLQHAAVCRPGIWAYFGKLDEVSTGSGK